jgi:hypothetical protein
LILYPYCVAFSSILRGFIAIVNHKGLSASPWNMPRLIFLMHVVCVFDVNMRFVFHVCIMVFRKLITAGFILYTDNISISQECGTESYAFW